MTTSIVIPTIKVATSKTPDWYYLVDADPETIEGLKTLPGVRLKNGVMQIHRSLVHSNPEFKKVYEDYSLWGTRNRGPISPKALEVYNTVLRPYQKEGVDFTLARTGTIIADETGVGKTGQALIAAELTGLKPVLVMGTLLSSGPWCADGADPKKFCGINVVHLTGRKTAGPEIFEQPNDGWFFCHYDILEAWLPWIFTKLRPKVAIFDEVHKISPRAKRGRAALSISRFKDMQLRVVISATPVKNKRLDMWMPLELAAPDSNGDMHVWGRRFCLPPDAPITMGDFTEKAIVDIKVGDEVVGWVKHYGKTNFTRKICKATVKAVLIKESPLQKVVMENGDEIICTPDHRWLNGKRGNGYQEYAEIREPGYPILCPDGRTFITRKKSTLVKFPSVPNFSYTFTEDYKIGYLYGAFMGDGHVSKTEILREYPTHNDKTRYVANHKVMLRVNDVELIQRCAEFLKDFGLDFKLTPPKSDEKLWHLNAYNGKAYNFFVPKPKKTFEWWRGFLGGIYDSEGSYYAFSQYNAVNPHIYNTIQECLDYFKFDYYKHDRGFVLRGGREMYLRFWGMAQPAIKRKLVSCIYYKPGNFTRNTVIVKKVIPLPGIHKVYTLTTTTGNYVAYNYASKNCGGMHGDYGWKYEGETHNEELKMRMSDMLIRRTKADVMAYLPAIVREGHEIELGGANQEEYDKYKSAERDIRAFLQKFEGKALAPGISGERLIQLGKLLSILSRSKYPATIELAADIATTNGKCVVFCWFKDVARTIATQLRARNINVYGAITGDDPVKVRLQKAKEFAADTEPAVYVATLSSASESINELVACQDMVVNDLYWNPQMLIQAEGRLHRSGQEGSVHAVYVTAKNTIDSDLLSTLHRKALAIETLGITDDAKGMVMSMGGQAPSDDLDTFIKSVEQQINDGGFGITDEDEDDED